MLVLWAISFYTFIVLLLTSRTILVKGEEDFKVYRSIEDINEDSTLEWHSKASDLRESDSRDNYSKDASIFKRTDNEPYELLLMMNESGVHWDILNMLANNPRVRKLIVNVTGGLIKGTGAPGKGTDVIFQRLNLTELGYHFWDSGLAISIMDGLLLDKCYRPTLAHLIESIALTYKEDIYRLVHNSNHRRLRKRDQTTSLSQLILASVLPLTSSNRAIDMKELCIALNETQMGVYTVKKFLADERYKNLTVALINDFVDIGALDSNLKSIDMSESIPSIMPNPSKSIMLWINRGIRNLSGSPTLISDLKKFSDKYSGAIKDMVQIMENDGFFNELNNHIFPENYSRRATKQLSTTTAARFIANKYRSSDASYHIRPTSSLFDYFLIYFQLLAVTSVSLLL